MAGPTAFEQEMLELINRARSDPAGEFDALIVNAGTRTAVTSDVTTAIRYFKVDLGQFKAQISGHAAVAPLAWNEALAAAARGHSDAMIRADLQSHRVPGELSTGDRIRAAGYGPQITAWAENIYAYTHDPVHGHAGFYIDWGIGPGGMQDPARHRLTMLSPNLTEVGIGAVADTSPATKVGPWVVTQDFGNRLNYRDQLVGVVIDDRDGDRFYDRGEGLGGVTVTARGAAGTFTTVTWASGGYQLELPKGTYTVTFSGGGLKGVVEGLVTMADDNIKLDAVAADAKPPSSHVQRGTSGDDVLVGGTGDDVLVGMGGRDRLSGGPGSDLLLAEREDAAFDAMAGVTYRLYQAALGRAPDLAGHLAWTEALLRGGLTPTEAANRMMASTEFQTRFGGATDAEDFITLLYQNVLGRDPDAGGLAAFTNALASGQTRASIVLRFVDSIEFQRSTAVDSLGFTRAGHQAEAADDVYCLYRATLGRDPDAGGFANWTEALARGRPLGTVIEGFTASAEFRGRYGDTTDEAFVTLLFRNVLGRDPSAAGLATWTGHLDGGMSRAQMVQNLAQSREFVEKSAAGLKDFVRGLGVDDRLDGGPGNDVMMGGIGADIFIFAPGPARTQTVVDLEPWDWIDLRAFGYADAAEARSHFTRQGDDLLFSDRGLKVLFADADLARLTDDQFLL